MAEETTTAVIDSDAPATDAPVGDDGAGGKRQLLADLARERDARQAAERAAADAQAELDKAREASMSEQEKAVAAAKAEGRDEALREATTKLVRAEIRVAAARANLADPADAERLLDPDRFVTRTGEVDDKAITAAIAALVKDKPYLSAMPGNGSGEGGPRGANLDPGFSMDNFLRTKGRAG